jgi:proton-coupled amino acid transporter
MSFIAVLAAILANEKLDSFISLIGAFACIPLAFTLPAFFHYRLCAFTNIEKYIDISIIVVSAILSVFSTVYTFKNW